MIKWLKKLKEKNNRAYVILTFLLYIFTIITSCAIFYYVGYYIENSFRSSLQHPTKYTYIVYTIIGFVTLFFSVAYLFIFYRIYLSFCKFLNSIID